MAQRTTDRQAEAQWEEATLTRDVASTYRATDAEITRPKSDIPEDRMMSHTSWHVHLELHSDEFDKLQRVGLTSHALAWREGMESWQPVDDGAQLRRLNDTLPPSSGMPRDGRTSGSQAQLRTGSFFDFVQKYARASQGELKQVIETRTFTAPPPPPPPRQQRSTDLPPPARSEDSALALGRHTPYGIVQQNQRLASTMPPPVAIEAVRTTQPPLRGFRRWAPLLTIVPVSAAVGALVASLVFSFRAQPLPLTSTVLPSRPAAAPLAPTACATAEPAGEKPATVAASSLPMVGTQAQEAPRVSLDALPAMGSRARSNVVATNIVAAVAAPVAVKANELPPVASEQTAERETRAERRARLRRAREERQAAAAAAQEERAQERRAQQEKAAAEKPVEHAPPPEPTPAGPPDRAAIGRAVAQAGNAATGCGSGPENGKAAVTFAPSGNVQSVRLIEPFSDSSVNGCVLRALGRARVPAFTGDAVEVHKSLKW